MWREIESIVFGKLRNFGFLSQGRFQLVVTLDFAGHNMITRYMRSVSTIAPSYKCCGVDCVVQIYDGDLVDVKTITVCMTYVRPSWQQVTGLRRCYLRARGTET